MLVVCEGLDCSGKTATVREAKKFCDAVSSKGIMSYTLPGRISSRFPCELTLLTELFYLDRTFVRPNLERGNNVIQDRWYSSLLAYNEGTFLRDLVIPKLSKPDVFVYVTVEREERLRRLREGENGHHIYLAENPRILEEMEERYMQIYRDFPRRYTIDTTHMSREDCGRELARIVNS